MFIIATNLPAFVHLAVTPHSICVEHGEPIHAAPSTPPTLAEALAARTNTATVASRGAPHHGGHHHCPLCQLSRELSSDAASPRAVTPTASPVSAGGELSDSLMVVATPRYGLAPKTSPPATGS